MCPHIASRAIHHCKKLGDVDLVIDCMSGLHPSAEVILNACKAGLRVVSANKRAIAHYWPQLQYFIEGDTKRLAFGAAVGGAVPVFEKSLEDYSILSRYPQRHLQLYCDPNAWRHCLR